MSTLLIRLAGPMQSWGTQSRFSIRDTGLEPSKSGVIGLLCAALGKPREENPGDEAHWPSLFTLAALNMGVRVDRIGSMKRDFHTALDVAKAGGGIKDCELSTRYYLADADFLVGLESGDETLLQKLAWALGHPVWPLSLGRKSFVPSVPVHSPDGLRSVPLLRALKDAPWFTRTPSERRRKMAEIEQGERDERPVRLRIVLDAAFGATPDVRCDVPLSFAERRFTIRHVKMDWAVLTSDMIQEELSCLSTSHV